MKSGAVRKTDFAHLVAELRRAGWSHRRIGKEIGVHENTVANWERGVEPLHSAGEALKDLHRAVCSTGSR